MRWTRLYESRESQGESSLEVQAKALGLAAAEPGARTARLPIRAANWEVYDHLASNIFSPLEATLAHRSLSIFMPK